jgi:hypothetical protein
MSCRHDLANTTCRRCWPSTGTVEPGPEGEYEPNMEGPGAITREEYQAANHEGGTRGSEKRSNKCGECGGVLVYDDPPGTWRGHALLCTYRGTGQEGPVIPTPGVVAEKLRRSGTYGRDLVVRNARVVSAEISRDATHATVTVQLDYGSDGSQSAGTHLLDVELVRRLMEVAGADRWSEIPGKVVRARASRTGGVAALGHVLEDDWLELGGAR